MIVELVDTIMSSQEENIVTSDAPENTLPRPCCKRGKTSTSAKEYALSSDLRFPWIQSNELDPEAFHSDSVLLWMSHAPVPLCHDLRAML
jgi:hypothetical protein